MLWCLVGRTVSLLILLPYVAEENYAAGSREYDDGCVVAVVVDRNALQMGVCPPTSVLPYVCVGGQ